jgi:cytochrome c5
MAKGMRVSLYWLMGVCVFPAMAEVKTAYVQLQGEHLQQGRMIWLSTCEGCHGYGIAGAPVPMVPDEWAPRLEKGKTVLYEHAINGYFGVDDTMMPARGGNPDLSDDEVKSAVDYMTALAAHYIQLERK